jgi:hypothetical protein
VITLQIKIKTSRKKSHRREKMCRASSLLLSFVLVLVASVIDPNVAYSQQRVEKQSGEVQQLKKQQLQPIPPPEVDLTCKIEVVSTGPANAFFGYRIKVKNKGTKTLNQVMFNWLITKQGVMVQQDGAGFGLMYPNTWYEASRGPFPKPPESYSIQVFVDPDNEQGESAALRGNNTCTK